MEKQDEFYLDSQPALYDKWLAVKNFFATSATSGDPSNFYANFLSGTGLLTPPYFVASGHSTAGEGAPRVWTGLTTPFASDKFPDFPRTACVLMMFCKIAYEGTNVLAAEYLLDGQVSGTVGLVMADFPGERLIASIILQNDDIGIDSIELPPETTDAPCGLLGFSIFCPFTGCGILGRLFGLCGTLL